MKDDDLPPWLRPPSGWVPPFRAPDPFASVPVTPSSMFGSLIAAQMPSQLLKPPKPKVFVSYHHANDQRYYNRFSELFSDVYDLFTDTSVGRKIDSDDPDYQSRFIREEHITGSSITIVLCGAETGKRKHVDWEIHATLEKQHALLGVVLPTCQKTYDGKFLVPDRLVDNVNSGYARWMHWSDNPQVVASWISMATSAVVPKLIDNARPQMAKNLP